MIRLPTVIGLLVCERVIVEKETDNLSLINCFTRKKVESFPSEPQRFAVVAFMTDGMGEIPMELNITRLDTLEVIEEQVFRLRFSDPLQEVRFFFRWTTCVFPEAGQYDIYLLAEGELLAQHRIHVG